MSRTKMASRCVNSRGPASEAALQMRDEPYPPRLQARFWMKVKANEDGCWVWQASKTGPGYGQFGAPSGNVLAHRFAYEMCVGPIPEELELDHLCRNRACVNPDHLEPVTQTVNLARGESPSAENARRTACKWGHVLAGPNLYVDPQGRRQCRICRQRASREAKRRLRNHSFPTADGVAPPLPVRDCGRVEPIGGADLDNSETPRNPA